MHKPAENIYFKKKPTLRVCDRVSVRQRLPHRSLGTFHGDSFLNDHISSCLIAAVTRETFCHWLPFLLSKMT